MTDMFLSCVYVTKISSSTYSSHITSQRHQYSSDEIHSAQGYVIFFPDFNQTKNLKSSLKSCGHSYVMNNENLFWVHLSRGRFSKDFLILRESLGRAKPLAMEIKCEEIMCTHAARLLSLSLQ